MTQRTLRAPLKRMIQEDMEGLTGQEDFAHDFGLTTLESLVTRAAIASDEAIALSQGRDLLVEANIEGVWTTLASLTLEGDYPGGELLFFDVIPDVVVPVESLLRFTNDGQGKMPATLLVIEYERV